MVFSPADFDVLELGRMEAVVGRDVESFRLEFGPKVEGKLRQEVIQKLMGQVFPDPNPARRGSAAWRAEALKRPQQRTRLVSMVDFKGEAKTLIQVLEDASEDVRRAGPYSTYKRVERLVGARLLEELGLG